MAKLFTLEEANSLLPRLRSILETLRDARLAIEVRRRELSAMPDKARFNGMSKRAQELLVEVDRITATLREKIGEAQDLGVEVKDLATGLVDFPSVRGGHEVYLCWKFDEDRVEWWHEVDTGFAGRQLL